MLDCLVSGLTMENFATGGQREDRMLDACQEHLWWRNVVSFLNQEQIEDRFDGGVYDCGTQYC